MHALVVSSDAPLDFGAAVRAAALALDAQVAFFVSDGPVPEIRSAFHGAQPEADAVMARLADAARDAFVRDRSEMAERTHERDARFSRRVDFRTSVDGVRAAIVLFGGDALGVSPAQRYVVRTLLDYRVQLAGLAAAETFRAQNAERLRLLESVVVNANDSVLITEAEPIDAPGPRILYANAAFTRTTGYEAAEVLGKSPRLLQGPHSDRAALDHLREALVAWRPIEVELLNYKKDGTPFWVELSIVPVPNETGFFTHWVSVQRDITERRAAAENALRAQLAEEQRAILEAEIRARGRVEERLTHTAYHDVLTGLPNRALFTLRLEAALASFSVTTNAGFSLLFLDLDRFKLVNDSLGHRTGDLLLIEVATQLRKCLRDGDMLARMGGDEFTILVDGPPENATAVAERILQTLGSTFLIEKNAITTSPSIGIVNVTHGDVSPSDVMRDADTAMYRAKLDQGGACYAVFDESMRADAVSRLRQELDLRGALATQQFVVEYQPIVDVANGTVYGVEALVRWNHPQDGLVGPNRFIPLAEATGDIVGIGAFVLREACREMAGRIAHGEREMQLSVNVSSRELAAGDAFVAHLERTLAETGMHPACLELEITEGILLAEADATRIVLQRIRALGCRVAFDDFGTGYSNLGYLVRYPIDTLKIDRSFVDGIETDGPQRDVVRTIALLAQSLRLTLVSEGIETEGQATILRDLGCTLQQGYLYGRSVSGSDLEAVTTNLRNALR
jgi:diguanylate cyclase (GGDEF)-like protein/PAS domain S-box-containing protein